jgi:ubiquinone/menaquinone biosynthesis C-methylase UbiE
MDEATSTGVSALSDDTHAGAQHYCRFLRHEGAAAPGMTVFVAGSGLGHEAAFIARELEAEVTGLDLKVPDAPPPGVTFLAGSVQELPFPDASVDSVFFHHVIEHVPDPVGAIAEIARVMKPGGWLYVGTPNRHRIVGYLGSFDASRGDIVRWNLADYRARLRGRFRNELGAHAGYSRGELRALLSRHFREVRPLTRDYITFKYGSRLPRPALAAITRTPLLEVVPASVYFACRKG